MKKYQPIIGLEVHIELKTKSKMFCGCPADYFGQPQNSLCCPVCLGLPGALPVPNQKAIEWCLKLGLALNCSVNPESKFDRKNYFYPDLPKGYQISQYDQPFAVNGWLKFNPATGGIKSKINKEIKIRVNRVHLEEDTGKLLHLPDTTLIDFNRSGVPLVEIVTEPDFRSSEEVVEYAKKLQQIVRYLDISDADMEKGSMRLEPSISLSKIPISKSSTVGGSASGGKIQKLPPYRVELKNINSFRFAKQAIEYEIKRQEELLNADQTILPETRGWDEKKSETVFQRRKELAHDYRYFPEPDIPPFIWTKQYINQLKTQIPELPDAKKDRFTQQYFLSDLLASSLCVDKKTANYFENACETTPNPETYLQIAHLIINKKVDIFKMEPKEIVSLILTKQDKTNRLSEDDLKPLVDKVLTANSRAVADYQKGKINALMFLVGQVMRETQGHADPETIKRTIVLKI